MMGAVVQVMGEMLQLSAGWHVSYALAPLSKHGQYQGVFNQGMTLAEAVGPVVQTAVISATGFFGFVIFGGIFLISGAALGPAVRRAEAVRCAKE